MPTLNHLSESLETALDSAQPAEGLSRRAAPRHLLVPPRPARLLVLAGQEYAFLVLLGLSLIVLPAWCWPLPLVLMAGRYHALGVLLHDATHMPLRNKGPAIRVLEILCGYPIDTTLNAMRYHHLRHHRDAGMRSDPYHKPGAKTPAWWAVNIGRGVLLVPFWMTRSWFGLAACAFPGIRGAYARLFLQDRSGEDLARSAEVRDCARAEIGLCLWQIGAAAVAFAFPGEALWAYALPVTLAGLLAAHRVAIEHSHQDVADRALPTQIAHTRDNFLGWAGRLALAPRNIGYHIVHHVHPQVSLEALPDLREWYRERYPGIYPEPRA